MVKAGQRKVPCEVLTYLVREYSVTFFCLENV